LKLLNLVEFLIGLVQRQKTETKQFFLN